MDQHLLQYGVAGVFIIVLLAAFKIYYNDSKKLNEQHAKDIKEIQQNYAQQMQKHDDDFFHELKKITERMSEDREEGRKVLKEHMDAIKETNSLSRETNNLARETNNLARQNLDQVPILAQAIRDLKK